MLVNAEVDLTALDVANSLRNVHGHGAGLRVRHEVTWAEDLTEAANLTHHVWGSYGCVEVGPAALDLLHEVVRADEVCASFTSCVSVRASCEDHNASGLTGAVWEVHGTANHLVCLTWVNREAENSLDSCAALRSARGLLDQSQSLVRLVQLAVLNLGGYFQICFAALCHLRLFSLCSCGTRAALDPSHSPRRGMMLLCVSGSTHSFRRLVQPCAALSHVCGEKHNYFSTSIPIERAVPAMILDAASTSLALRSFILYSAISLT